MKQNFQGLMPHQIRAIEYMESKCVNQSGILLFFLMGTGKTITSLAWAMNYTEECVVFVPEIIKEQWYQEHEKIGATNKTSVHTHQDLYRMYATSSLKGKVVIIDEVHKIVDWILLQSDEKSTGDFYKYIWSADKVVVLSGTPFNSKRSDIGYIINMVAKKVIVPVSSYEFYLKYVKLDNSILKQAQGKLTECEKHGFFQCLGLPHQIAKHIIKFDVMGLRHMLKPSTLLMIIQGLFVFNMNSVIGYNENEFWAEIRKKTGFKGVQDSVSKFWGNVFGFFNTPPLTTESQSQTPPTTELQIKSSGGDAEAAPVSPAKLPPLNVHGFFLNFIVKSIFFMIMMQMSQLYLDPNNELENGELNAELFFRDCGRYINYYNYVDEDDSQKLYPTFSETTVRHRYNPYQLQILVELMNNRVFSTETVKALLEVDDDVSIEYAKKKLLEAKPQEFLKRARIIGNLVNAKKKDHNFTFSQDGTTVLATDGITLDDFIDCEKFNYLYTQVEKSRDQKLYKFLVYSNFRKSGCTMVSLMLTLMKVPHAYLNTRLSSERKMQMVEDFNRTDGTNSFSVMIIDDDTIEGLNLMGVRELHIVEPLMNPSQCKQLIYRCIRAYSHHHLPPSDQHVVVFHHLAVVYKYASMEAYEKGFFSKTLRDHLETKLRFHEVEDISHSYWDKHFSERFSWLLFKGSSLKPEDYQPDIMLYKNMEIQGKDMTAIIDIIKGMGSSPKIPEDCVTTHCSIWKGPGAGEQGTCVLEKQKLKEKQKTMSRKSRQGSRKSRQGSRKSRQGSHKSRQGSHKSRQGSRKSSRYRYATQTQAISEMDKRYMSSTIR